MIPYQMHVTLNAQMGLTVATFTAAPPPPTAERKRPACAQGGGGEAARHTLASVICTPDQSRK